jgi:hypothetical protein
VFFLLCFIGIYVIGQRKAANRKREAEDRLKAQAMLEAKMPAQMQLRKPRSGSDGYRIRNLFGQESMLGGGFWEDIWGKSTVGSELNLDLSGGRVITYPPQFLFGTTSVWPCDRVNFSRPSICTRSEINSVRCAPPILDSLTTFRAHQV